MCGRFVLSKPGEISKRFKADVGGKVVKASYNVSPGMMLPIIIKKSPNRVVMMRWGLIPEWSKDGKFQLINIRVETAKTKGYFKKLLLTKRCLVPADGFYEWQKLKLDGKVEKVPYVIYLRSKEMFAFAGVYEEVKDAEGRKLETFAILTQEPNEVVKPIHNRMPVILQEDDEERWLNSGVKELERVDKMLTGAESEKMAAHQVSKRVNYPGSDDAGLIEENG